MHETFEKETALTAPAAKLGLVASMAMKFSLSPAVFQATIKRTVMPPGSTDEELCAFLMVAQEYGLNPILREIHCFPKKGGGIMPVVSIDGWISMCNRHPQFDGVTFKEIFTDGSIFAVETTIYRKDRSHPVVITEYTKENRRNTDPWNANPIRMTRHRSHIQCSRIAFGFSGIMDEDDGEIMRAVDGVVIETPADALKGRVRALVSATPAPAAPTVDDAKENSNSEILDEKQASYVPNDVEINAAKKNAKKKGVKVFDAPALEGSVRTAEEIVQGVPELISAKKAPDEADPFKGSEPVEVEKTVSPLVAQFKSRLDECRLATEDLKIHRINAREVWSAVTGEQRKTLLRCMCVKSIDAFKDYGPVQLRKFIEEAISIVDV